MKVTAETITDEQITELRKVAAYHCNYTFVRVADIARGDWDPDDTMPGIDRELIVLGARVRCAEDWNRRYGADK